MMNLKDKYVVITGASSGFGRAAAVAFAGEGAHLILGARRVERLNETAMMACKAGAASVLVVPVDVTRTESVEVLQQTLGYQQVLQVEPLGQERRMLMVKSDTLVHLITLHIILVLMVQHGVY